MKVNNKLGLILGIIGGLALLCMSLLMMVVMVVAITLIVTTNKDINVLPFTVCSYISIFSSIIAIIGAIISFRHTKVGGIILIISALLCASFPIALFTYNLNFKFSTVAIFIVWILLLLMTLSAGVISVAKKNKQPETLASNSETIDKI